MLAPGLTFDGIDKRRARSGVAVERLVAEAGVHRDTWFLARRGAQMREATLQRLADALDRLIVEAPAARPPFVVAALVRAVVEILRQAAAGDGALMAALDPHRRRASPPAALPATRLQSLAVYLIAVELEVPNAELARALGVTRQNVKKLRTTIEDLREDERVDALFARCAAVMTGRG